MIDYFKPVSFGYPHSSFQEPCGPSADHRQVQSIFFQFRPVLSDDWQDMPVISPTTNPVTSLPFGVFWDLSNVPGGKYTIRAVLINKDNYTDPAPPAIDVWVAREPVPQTLTMVVSLDGDTGEVISRRVHPVINPYWTPPDEPMGTMLIEACGERGQVVYEKRIFDPRLEFWDDFGPDGKIVDGGTRYTDHGSFIVTFPYTDRIAYLKITSHFKGKLQEIGPINVRK